MGKNCNIFNYKIEDSHHEVVVQISELNNHKMAISEVQYALNQILNELIEIANQNDCGNGGLFPVPIEK